MPSIQETVHRFFNDNISRGSDIDTPSAIYQFLGERGFLQAHVSERWRAFAKSVGYFYVGDIDIQNKVATGVIPITIIDADAQAYFDAMTVQPDAGQKTLLNDLIVGLKADGIWSRIKWLSLAGHHQQAMRLNMVNPSQVAAAFNSPTFTAYRGYQGDGSSSYLDSNVSNSTVLDTDHSLFFAANLTDPTRSSVMGSVTNRHMIVYGNPSNNPLFYGFTSTLATVSSPAADKDIIIGSRSGGNSIVQANATSGSPAAVSTVAPSAANIRLMTTTVARFSATGFGLSLNETQRNALRTHLLTYLTAIGAA